VKGREKDGKGREGRKGGEGERRRLALQCITPRSSMHWLPVWPLLGFVQNRFEFEPTPQIHSATA